VHYRDHVHGCTAFDAVYLVCDLDGSDEYINVLEFERKSRNLSPPVKGRRRRRGPRHAISLRQAANGYGTVSVHHPAVCQTADLAQRDGRALLPGEVQVTVQNKHAIVLGASMAGLLAARALADHYTHVTLFERDILPGAAEPRKGVPQGRHAHGLLSRGREILEGYFPGFTAELEDEGAVVVDLARDARWHVGGGYFAQPTAATGLLSLAASRPKLEAHVRKRLLAQPNIELIENCDVLGFVASSDNSRILGVRVRRGGSEMEEVQTADLVVDATGRGSRTPAWLKSLGYEAPEEERVEVNIGYASQLYRRETPLVAGAAVLIGSSEPGATRAGLYVPFEDDRWMVTLIGYFGDYPPTDPEGFRAFARHAPTPEVAELVDQARPIGNPVGHRFPASLRRRYERLRRFPDSLLVVGDALCSFNPVYGQGMTVAAIEADALGDCLAKGSQDLARRFFKTVARVIDTPWSMAVGADLRYPEVDAPRGLASRFLNWYTARLQYAARFDSQLAVTFIRVGNLSASPASLLSPATVWRVLRGNVRRVTSNASSPQLEFLPG
jgi:2-polyprenyl-6-methoxyphenol hydroxylase-like FAD-dependent oxidoreductase